MSSIPNMSVKYARVIEYIHEHSGSPDSLEMITITDDNCDENISHLQEVVRSSRYYSDETDEMQDMIETSDYFVTELARLYEFSMDQGECNIDVDFLDIGVSDLLPEIRKFLPYIKKYFETGFIRTPCGSERDIKMKRGRILSMITF